MLHSMENCSGGPMVLLLRLSAIANPPDLYEFGAAVWLCRRGLSGRKLIT